MKKYLSYLLLPAVLLLADCKKELEKQWYHNTNLVINVQNEAGKDILDPRYGGNILGDGISVVYDGETMN